MNANIAYQHEECDRVLNLIMCQPQNQKPCCAKGCSACCSEPVYATEAEVDHILEALNEDQKSEIALRLCDWLDKTGPLLHESMPDAIEWRNLNAVCPFLKHNLCSIYSRRPFSCRVWYAVGNPKNCEMPAREHQKFLIMPDALMSHMAQMTFRQGPVALDNMGVLLAEKLLGMKLMSGSRQLI